MSEKPACAQNQTWMEEEFSRELSPELRPKMQAHLEGCEDCRSIWADYQALRRGMEVLAQEEGPSLRVQNAVLRAAESKIEKRVRTAGFWSWLLKPATIAFATLALIVGVSYLGHEELQKRKNSELSAPVLAPQGTSVEGVQEQGNAGKASTAPASLNENKLKQEKIAPATTKPATFSAPAKPEAPKQAPAEAERARRAVPPPPPPAADQVAPAIAPNKSLAQPVSPLDRPQTEAPAAPSGAVIPEADTGSGAGLGGFKKDEAADKAKHFDKGGAPAEATPKELESSKTPELQILGATSQEKAKESVDRAPALLDSAKAKIKKKDYSGALDDLLAAQRLKDSKEIQDLILLCRSHLRGDE